MVFIEEIIYLKQYGAYVINLDGYESTETHWIALCSFDSFGVEPILKEIRKFIKNKNITNIYRIGKHLIQ